MTYSVSNDKKYFFKFDNNLNFMLNHSTTYDLNTKALFSANDSLGLSKFLIDERNLNLFRSYRNYFKLKNIYNYSNCYVNISSNTNTIKQHEDEYSILKIFNPKNKLQNIKVKKTSQTIDSIIKSEIFPAPWKSIESYKYSKRGSLILYPNSENDLFNTTNNPSYNNPYSFLYSAGSSEAKIYQYINTFLHQLIQQKKKTYSITTNTYPIFKDQKINFTNTGSYLYLDVKSNNKISGLTCIQNNSLQNSIFCSNYYVNNSISAFESSKSYFKDHEASIDSLTIPKIVLYDNKSSITYTINDNNSQNGLYGGINRTNKISTKSPNLNAGNDKTDTNAIFNLKSISNIDIHNNQGGRIYDDHPAYYSVTNTRTFWEY